MKSTESNNPMRKHPLIEMLRTTKGNPKVLLLLEPLWGIPFHLIAPFAALYMSEQGIIDAQIGLLLTITMLGQVFFSFFGGIITDKLGRLPATLIGDFFGFVIACSVWAISHNFWLFMIAALFNSFERIAMTSWQCLVVEDADQKEMLRIYTWIHIGGLVAVFFAPITGFLIARFTLIPVIRVLYVFFAMNMFIKCVLTYKFCTETKQGKIRKAETKAVPIRTMIKEYGRVVPQIFRSAATLKIVAINSLLHVTGLVSSTFFGLYVTRRLGVEESFLAVFPILNAVVMLLFMFVVQHRIAYIKDKIPLRVGLMILVVCHISLILLPANQIILIFVYLFFVAVANALIGPRTGAMLQLAIDPQERARIMAIAMCFTIVFAAPFGFLAGLLSELDDRLPFILTTTFFIIAIVIVSLIKKDEFRATSQEGAEKIE